MVVALDHELEVRSRKSEQHEAETEIVKNSESDISFDLTDRTTTLEASTNMCSQSHLVITEHQQQQPQPQPQTFLFSSALYLSYKVIL